VISHAACRCHREAALADEELSRPAEIWRARRRRGDALLRLGGALQRLHRFDEARAAWLGGSEALPEHAELRREAAAARAYHIAPPPHASPPGKRKRPAAAAEARILATRGGRRIALSLQPLLSPAACDRVVELCETSAAKAGGWSTLRHTSVPTTDMEVWGVGEVLTLFNECCASSLFPFLEATYAESRLKVSASRLRVWDAFVVRYDAAAQRSLPTHQDDSHLSLTIALNETSEYDGGGTSFEDLDGEGFVRPEKGCVVAFPGELRHGGRAVTRGVRYIIAVFLWVAEEPVSW